MSHESVLFFFFFGLGHWRDAFAVGRNLESQKDELFK